MNFEKKLVDFINAEFLDGSEELSISSDTELLDNGIIDSINMIKLLTYIEEELSITLQDDDLSPENFNSVMSISGILNKNAN